MKVWQSQVNVSAWLQGQYVLAAIGSCLPDGCHYPEKPLEVFKDTTKELPTSNNDEEDNIKKEFQKIALRLAANK